MSEKTKIGLIGCGYWGTETHLPVYKKIFDAEVVALSDLNIKNLEKASKAFEIRKIYTDYMEMLEKESLDIVSVVTPAFTHARIAIDAAEHGCNVFVEKPMATSLEEVDHMVAAVKKSGVKLMVDENYRWLPEFMCAKKHIDNGTIGDPFYVEVRDSVWWTYGGKSGHLSEVEKLIMLDMSVHYVDVIRWFANSKVEHVHAITRKARPDVKGDTFCIITMEFENGLVGLIVDSFASKGRQYGIRTRIDGAEGSIMLNWERPVMIWSEKEPLMGWLIPEVEGDYSMTKKDLFSTEPFKWPWKNFVNGTYHAMKAFIKAIKEGIEPPVSGEEYRKTMEVILAGYESAKEHKVIRVG